MRSVGTFLLYSLAINVVSSLPSGYDGLGHHGGRGRTKVIVVREPERHREVYEVRHVLRRKQRPVVVRTELQPVSVVHEVARPDVVVVDHGGAGAGAGYLQPQPVITQVAPVAPVAPAPVYPTTRASAIDPYLLPVLRGSSPQEGDPLGIYPGGGLDPRVDPALLPAARAQLADEVRLLQTELDILTRRLGVSRGTSTARGADDGGLQA